MLCVYQFNRQLYNFHINLESRSSERKGKLDANDFATVLLDKYCTKKHTLDN